MYRMRRFTFERKVTHQVEVISRKVMDRKQLKSSSSREDKCKNVAVRKRIVEDVVGSFDRRRSIVSE